MLWWLWLRNMKSRRRLCDTTKKQRGPFITGWRMSLGVRRESVSLLGEEIGLYTSGKGKESEKVRIHLMP